ncbi:uncharacterized protein LOC118457320 isoform X4 [Anopheles albimanus]|uniref:uncharacterized protein LOC118457320 isoform X4 n=1 Tax=Anopheles albimanus TaxID=7167 RepID=UPI0016417DBE|nr:uncharacterized protein LOC118457320 isoform X4 [Anopheles albimanus]
MLSSVWASLGKEQGLARALKQTMDEAATRSSSGQRRKPIPLKPPRRKNQQQQVTQSQRRPIDMMGIAKKIRKEHEHCDEQCAEEIITKAFQFLTRPKRSRDMTASEILEYYLERRQRAQLEQQSAVERALDKNTSNSSFTSTLTYLSNLDTTGHDGIDESKTRRPSQLFTAEEDHQHLVTKKTAPKRFGDFRLYPDSKTIEMIEQPYAEVDGTAKCFQHKQKQHEQKLLHHYQEAITVAGRPVRKSMEDVSLHVQQHIFEPTPLPFLQTVVPKQPQKITTPIVTSTTTGYERVHRWHNMWRKLKRICLPHRSRHQKNQPTVAEQPLTDQQAACNTYSNNNLHQRTELNSELGSRFDSHRRSMKKRTKSQYRATRNCRAI